MSKPLKIVLTGPESVGKSTLSQQLAAYYGVAYVSELAREYITNLGRDYKMHDVLEIARLQIEAEHVAIKKNDRIIFFDTDLIITKIWLLHVYGTSTAWIDKHLRDFPADFHLLCYYDLPWEADPLRENPDIRPLLFEKYQDEIAKLGIDYDIVKGQGITRFENSVQIIDRNFSQYL
jgi:nicotinamide riboside kinase